MGRRYPPSLASSAINIINHPHHSFATAARMQQTTTFKKYAIRSAFASSARSAKQRTSEAAIPMRSQPPEPPPRGACSVASFARSDRGSEARRKGGGEGASEHWHGSPGDPYNNNIKKKPYLRLLAAKDTSHEGGVEIRLFSHLRALLRVVALDALPPLRLGGGWLHGVSCVCACFLMREAKEATRGKARPSAYVCPAIGCLGASLGLPRCLRVTVDRGSPSLFLSSTRFIGAARPRCGLGGLCWRCLAGSSSFRRATLALLRHFANHLGL